jgi:predicted nuclease of predicted toxin-antitoxin system
MSVSLYMDEHVHRAITTELRRRGVDVLTVQEENRQGLPDLLVLDRATELQRIVFSQDQDFLVEANRRQTEGIPFAGVIYARQLGITVGECIRDLEILAQAGHPEDFLNQVIYLPL